MKYLILCGDGMADYPIAELNGQTPVEAAKTPAMDAIAAAGLCAMFSPIPEDLPAGSEIGNLSLFGYDPHAYFTGRAPLEARNQGIDLGPGQVAFRCNLVTLDDGVMASFTSDHISTEESAQLIAALNEHFADQPLFFNTGVGYRHLSIIDAADLSVDALAAASCTPPHNIPDQPYEPALPQGEAGEYLRGLIAESHDLLRDHPVNKARRRAGKKAATSIWLWGQGKAPSMPTYGNRFGLTGGVISAVDLVNGIGVCAGLEVVRVPGATGYLDTNYAGKVAGAIDLLDRADFAYLHVEAPDETSHEGKLELKMQAVEDFDAKVVAPCLAYAQQRGDVRVLVAPDHVTALSTKCHAGGPVPFEICGPGIEKAGANRYGETAAAELGDLYPQGHRLVEAFLQAETLAAPAAG